MFNLLISYYTIFSLRMMLINSSIPYSISLTILLFIGEGCLFTASSYELLKIKTKS